MVFTESRTHERKVVFPQPGSPSRRILTVARSSSSILKGRVG